MRQLLFASRNKGKACEVASILRDIPLEVITLNQTDIPNNFDIDETGNTFKDNAILKAKGFGVKVNLLTLADDSGLEVDALNGRPGVYSKRYGTSDEKRIAKLLSELAAPSNQNRTARFVCVVCLFDPKTGETTCKKGIVEGVISLKPLGDKGFGYDPIFIPTEGDGRTFGEYSDEFKNKISHRARALEKIKTIL